MLQALECSSPTITQREMVFRPIASTRPASSPIWREALLIVWRQGASDDHHVIVIDAAGHLQCATARPASTSARSGVSVPPLRDDVLDAASSGWRSTRKGWTRGRRNGAFWSFSLTSSVVACRNGRSGSGFDEEE